MSEHALTRLGIILGSPLEHAEIAFMKQYILPVAPQVIAWNRGLTSTDIALFAQKCKKLNVMFLGMEVHFDSPYPCYCFTFEDFNTEYDSEWYYEAASFLTNKGIKDFIIPSIRVPRELLKLTGLFE